MRTRRRLLLGIGLFVGSGVLLLAVLVLHHSVVPLVHADSFAAERLQSKVEQAEIAAANGHPQVVSADESELNSMIESRLRAMRAARKGQGSLRDLKVHLVNGQIGVHVLLNIYGQDMTLDIAGTLRTQGGFVQFDPVSGSVGALPIPRSALQTAVREAMASPASRKDLRLPGTLSDLRTEGSKLVVTYE